MTARDALLNTPRKSAEVKLGEARLDAGEVESRLADREATIAKLEAVLAELREQVRGDRETLARITGGVVVAAGPRV